MKARSIFLGFCLLALGFFPQDLSVGSDDNPGIQPPYPQITPEIKGLRSGPPSFGDLPLSFEANLGQIEDRVKFLCRGIHSTLYLTPTEAVLELARSKSSAPAIVRMKFEGAAASPRVIGEDKLPGTSNYFIGNDPKAWLTKIPHFARIRYKRSIRGWISFFTETTGSSNSILSLLRELNHLLSSSLWREQRR